MDWNDVPWAGSLLFLLLAVLASEAVRKLWRAFRRSLIRTRLMLARWLAGTGAFAPRAWQEINRNQTNFLLLKGPIKRDLYLFSMIIAAQGAGMHLDREDSEVAGVYFAAPLNPTLSRLVSAVADMSEETWIHQTHLFTIVDGFGIEIHRIISGKRTTEEKEEIQWRKALEQLKSAGHIPQIVEIKTTANAVPWPEKSSPKNNQGQPS